MTVFRVCKSKHANDLSGKGGALRGGRWNSKGIAVLYTSQSRALCTAEVAVHLPLGYVPKDYVLVSIEIPDSIKMEVPEPRDLPADWKLLPSSTQKIGDDFVTKGNDLVLKVPSAVVQDEFNFLINPNHPDFKKMKVIKVEPFTFDERLFIR